MKKINCEYLQSVLLDFIDKNLSIESTQQVKSHMESCKSCRNEMEKTLILLEDMRTIEDEEPPVEMRKNFLQLLEQEKSNLQGSKTRKIRADKKKIWLYNPFSQIAAGLTILISGVLLGFILNNKPSNQQDVSQLQEQVFKMKEMLFMAKLDQSSASQRIQAVNLANDLGSPDPRIIDALINTMNTDDNVNVRMASMHALAKFTSNENVRNALVKSLETQKDALLQVTLINILVEIQEKKAIDVMRKLLQKEETIEAVKQMAEKGLTTFI